MAEIPPKGCRIIPVRDAIGIDDVTRQRLPVAAALNTIPDWRTIDAAEYRELGSMPWQFRRIYARQAFATIIERVRHGQIPELVTPLKKVDPETKLRFIDLLNRGGNSLQRGVMTLTTTAETNLTPRDMQGEFASGGIIPFRLRITTPDGDRVLEAETNRVVLNAHHKIAAPPSRLETLTGIKVAGIPSNCVDQIISALATAAKTEKLVVKEDEELARALLSAREMDLALGWLFSVFGKK